jgi:phosphate transport system substrate-binding protein
MQMIVRRLSLVVLAVMVSSSVVSSGGSRTGTDLPPGTVQLRGAGSTFAAPLYKTWLDAYQTRHPQVALSYEAIGSGEGTQQFLSGAVDFGASDAAMTDEEMAEVARGVQLVPALAGSIVLAYNLEGLGGPLKLPRAVYIDIFSGKITS